MASTSETSFTPVPSPLTLLRTAQFGFAVISLGLVASVASAINTSTIETPPQLNFLLFTSIFTLLIVIPYVSLATRYFPRLANAYVMLSAELSTALFWFAGFIAVADWVRKHHGPNHGSAIAGTCFASFELTQAMTTPSPSGLTVASILFAISTSFALSHLLSLPTSTLHKRDGSSSSSSSNPTTYKRTQYHAHARPLSFRSFRSGAVASAERARAHRLRALQQAQPQNGTSTGPGRSCSRFDLKTGKSSMDSTFSEPNIVLVTSHKAGDRHQGQNTSTWSPDSPQEDPLAWSVRPYSTRIAAVGERLLARAKMPKGLHATWFGKESKVDIAHPGGENRRWDGADVV